MGKLESLLGQIQEAAASNDFIVATDHILGDVAELGGEPVLLADNRVVPTRKLGTADIASYHQWRPSIPIHSPQYMWDGSNNAANAANASWQGVSSNFTKAFKIRKMSATAWTSRTGILHIPGWIYQRVSSTPQTWTVWRRDVTLHSVTNVAIREGSGSDLGIRHIDAMAEDTDAIITIAGRVVQVGETVYVPPEVSTVECPSTIYQFTQNQGEAYALDPIDSTLIEYHDGQLRLSQAPGPRTTLTAYQEITQQLASLENRWRVSNQEPDVTDSDWQIWTQKNENKIAIYLRVGEREFINLKELL